MGKLGLMVEYAKRGTGPQILTPVLAFALPTPALTMLLHTHSNQS